MGKSSCARILLLSINIVALILSITIVGLTLYVLLDGAEQTQVVQQLSSLPVELYYAVIGFNLSIFLISLLGVLGTAFRSKFATVSFVVLTMITLIAQIVFAILVLLYANGQSTIVEVDSSVAVAQAEFEKTLVTKAVTDPTLWIATQDAFQCCGVDFEATYLWKTPEFSANNQTAFIDLLHPTDACAAGRGAILALQVQFPDYNADAEAAALQTAALQSYFCKDEISSFVKTNTAYIGGILAGLVVIQLISLVSAFVLLCKVTTTHGGFVIPKDEENTGGALAFGAQGNGKPQGNALGNGNTYA